MKKYTRKYKKINTKKKSKKSKKSNKSNKSKNLYILRGGGRLEDLEQQLGAEESQRYNWMGHLHAYKDKLKQKQEEKKNHEVTIIEMANRLPENADMFSSAVQYLEYLNEEISIIKDRLDEFEKLIIASENKMNNILEEIKILKEAKIKEQEELIRKQQEEADKFAKELIADEEKEKKKEKTKKEKQKKSAEESERQRKAHEEAKKERLAAQELERLQKAAEETERKRLASQEAQRQRLAAQELERQRKAAEESERLKKAAEETERKRIAAEETERQRLASEKAARQQKEIEDKFPLDTTQRERPRNPQSWSFDLAPHESGTNFMPQHNLAYHKVKNIIDELEKLEENGAPLTHQQEKIKKQLEADYVRITSDEWSWYDLIKQTRDNLRNP